ncbi:glucose dehydrogenase [FAD, quinone]-like [Atheta coriaria]|uniref:glucose dehydrogenase [FAD, quinone]-like n=1 Tax=Dalotia coriaria TaxID=877792 RepID=UPI0031F417BA
MLADGTISRTDNEFINKDVLRYVKIIEDGIANSLIYFQHENAYEFQDGRCDYDDCPPINYGYFDFIIVGSGASGSVIANRLTEVEHFNVLLLDAGHFEDEFIKIPGLMSYSAGTDYNWGIKSVPQRNACLAMEENRCQLFRGRGIGGSTIVSPLIYARPLPSDFAKWNALASGWSYQDVLPYFIKAENFSNSASILSKNIGRDGPLWVEVPNYTTPHIDAFLKSNLELGFPEININNLTDITDTNIQGVSRVQINTQNGRRLSVGSAYITPIIHRKNLNISVDNYATKVIFSHGKSNKKHAVGVEFFKNNQKHIAMARKEVILSSGTISTPQLLIQSGIGPKNDLIKLEIDQIVDSPHVGKNYQTHVAIFGLSIETNTSVNILSLEDNVKLYLGGKGVLTMGGNRGAIGNYTIPNKQHKTTLINTQHNNYDLEFIFLTPNRTAGFYQSGYSFKPEEFKALTNNLTNQNTFSIFISPRYPKSIGGVRVTSKNKFDFPSVNPNLLSDENNFDIEAIYQGILLLKKMLNTKAMRHLNAKFKRIILPDCKFKLFSKEYWYCFIRQTSNELFHPVGTNKMASGSNPQNGVVDEQFKVNGVHGLRVADASIIPFSMTGHSAATCVMIGERCADFIKNDYY